jgi:signal transduction histidine kinase
VRRPWQSWLLFAAGLVVLLAAMGWVTVTALRLDRAEAAAREQAALEENVRLALWRMDSLLAPIVAREGARPYFVYAPLYIEDRPYGRMTGDPLPGDEMVPSPLLGATPERVLLHFQLDEFGLVSSPQVPTPGHRELAGAGGVSLQAVAAHGQTLSRLAGSLDRPALLAALPAAGEELPVPASGSVVRVTAGPEVQQAEVRGKADWNARQNVANQAKVMQQKATQEIYSKKGAPLLREIEPGPLAEVSEGLMTPLWSGETLLLARRVKVGVREYVQGCWLDWPALREELLASVGDLLPGADLVPAAGAEGEESRMLAALPVRLVPGEPPRIPGSAFSPIRAALVLAWICVLLAAGSVGFVLFGALSLSERRGAFVSAVTHELRTPLTTFRMYSEMLDEGMVRDEEKRGEYYRTLRGEADRLGHLVENVLAYSRLEGGKGAGRLESVTLEGIVARVRERLEGRATEDGMELAVEGLEEAGAATVRADVSAVEQVLFNLVDNAAKYAARAGDRRIHLTAGAGGGRPSLRVRDHGPGLTPAEGRRLFQPFSRPAGAEAAAPPGIGLGLALSRRLARAMGGDLALDPGVGEGAAFVLTLPRA